MKCVQLYLLRQCRVQLKKGVSCALVFVSQSISACKVCNLKSQVLNKSFSLLFSNLVSELLLTQQAFATTMIQTSTIHTRPRAKWSLILRYSNRIQAIDIDPNFNHLHLFTSSNAEWDNEMHTKLHGNHQKLSPYCGYIFSIS